MTARLTPNTTELYASHIPALATLINAGWSYLPPAQVGELRRSNREVVLKPLLEAYLRQHRFEYRGECYPLSADGVQQVVNGVLSLGLGEGLMVANQRLHERLTLGVTITEFMPNGQKHAVTVPLVNWQDVEVNDFQITEEFEVLSVHGTHTRRPDLVGFLNGIPVVVIEAKQAASGNPNKSMIDEGVSQTLRNQKVDEIPLLFAYSQLVMAISLTDGRYATTGTPAKFWMRWVEEQIPEVTFERLKNQPLPETTRQALFDDKPPSVRAHFEALWSKPVLPTEQDRMLISLLRPDRLLKVIRFYLLFSKGKKIVARYPQFFAIEALIEQITQFSPDGSRQGGVVWHTTGSGKSFTMVFLSQALILHQALKACRVLVVTDRVDLEKQLSNTFAEGGALGLQSVGGGQIANRARASSGRELAREIGQGNQRVLFTLIDKFRSAVKHPECYNPSENFLVLVDEGHRSHGGENHVRMRNALPGASFIAFTGTPLIKRDKTTTAERFGPIVHAYTMRKAVDDGTVTPLLYEERRPELDINEASIDAWFDKITLGLSDEQKADLKKKYAKRGAIYGAKRRIQLIAWDISLHFERHIKQYRNGLKAQLACDSKLSAIRYKQELDEIGKVTSRVVISSPDTREGHESIDEATLPEVQQWWKANVPGDAEAYERKAIEEFGADGEPDLLIVVDKLLTGFDEPRNGVLYIDKPLKGHNLIQAIARVNRLHEEKPFGLLVDYRGILKELDTAIQDYQDLEEQTQGGYDIEDIEGLYHNVDTEYKRLPGLHERLWRFFAEVENTADQEAFRRVLMPHYEQDEDGHDVDVRQALREDFYAALTEFGMCLKLALSSQSFFQDKSFSEATVSAYKRDLRWFVKLRQIARQDAQETVDYSTYEKQIRKLVDSDVTGLEVRSGPGLYAVEQLGQQPEEEWSDEKARNEADRIRTRTKKTIEQELGDDPYAQKVFSELLRQAIQEADALFDFPGKQYALLKEVEEQVRERNLPSIPAALKDNAHARAYYGVFRLQLGEIAFETMPEEEHQALVDEALAIDALVDQQVAMNTLNPQDIEAGIRRELLPSLFKRFGLEQAKAIIDDVIQIVRVGRQRG
ncbi:type I restriction endonuclease subunit R [Halomonas alkalicola]|uniref:Type I restriction enzyme endonuclease subunit n=1 Tax=Halomonas alkalicola TaxID=1930622 RepID=A0ABY9H983_9GAMM|nr:HsdR family type I site-specific deoxyribonuclease [Halomonas alkalicola]WLI74883.1 HsdR family type I site-specific deoxyribonuclease [Halomonas alkalicola]